MIPNITRGGKLPGFVNYLVGPGRFNEHSFPHIVAGDDVVLAAVSAGVELSVNDALDVANVLERPRKLYGVEVTSPVREFSEELGRKVTVGRRPSHMWQCSLSLNGEVEGPLSDAAWNQIADEFMQRMGFVDPDRGETSRWVAIRHGVNRNGNDHIHIVAQMVTENGSKANVHNDRSRSQKVCRELEREFGLALVEGAHAGQTLPHEKRGERERATREKTPWMERKELRRRLRGALAASSSEADFVRHVFGNGVAIRPRFAPGTTTKVVGYSVALAPPPGMTRAPIWYAPSKLDPNLSLPKVREAVGAHSGGDPEAVGSWQEHHSAGLSPIRSPRPMSEELAGRLMQGSVTAGELSRVMASLSLKFEPDKPGRLAEASEQLSQVSVNPPPLAVGHMARLQARAASKDAATGWHALLVQAARLSRSLAQSAIMESRPQMSREHAASMNVTIAESHALVHAQSPRIPAPLSDSPARKKGSGISEVGRLAAMTRSPAPSRKNPSKGDPRSPSRPKNDPSAGRDLDR